VDILINLDHGAIPAALSNIQADLAISNFQTGMLGSGVFFGVVCGSASATIMYQKFEYKSIIYCSLLVNGAALFLLTLNAEFYVLCLSRFVSGFSQVYIVIYKPVFIDTYADRRTKSFLMAMQAVTPALGVVIGYVMTSCIISAADGAWQISFLAQSIASIAAAVLAFMVPKMYLNIDDVIVQKRQYVRAKNTEEIEAVERQNGEGAEEGAALDGQPLPQEVLPRVGLREVCLLLSNGPYVFLVLTGAEQMFVVSGTQYWVTYYLIEVLDTPQKQAFFYFASVAISAPVLGAVLSGSMTTWIGGFTSVKALPQASVFAVVAVVGAVLVPLVDDAVACVSLIWVSLLGGAFVLPVVVGVMLTKVEPEMRATANALCYLIWNLLGCFPSPFVYGLANELSGQGNKSRWGMMVLMDSSVFILVFIILAMVADRKADYSQVFRKAR